MLMHSTRCALPPALTCTGARPHRWPARQVSEDYGDEEDLFGAAADPPRVWIARQFYPGSAFTRSIGTPPALRSCIARCRAPCTTTCRLTVGRVHVPSLHATRTGDAIGKSAGVTAEPEILSRKLVPEDKYLIVCSDGVFEFLTNEEVIDMVHSHTDPYLAACDLVELRCAALFPWYPAAPHVDETRGARRLTR
jgi:serine/threonine protein phosphatase PrpC